MLAGQVGVVHHGTGFLARQIEDITHSNAHHVVIAVSETHCMSAEWPRVRVRPISTYPHVTWTQYRLTPDLVERVVNDAWAYLGVKYNVAAFVTLGAHHLTGWPIPRAVGAWLNGRRYVTCSQMCTQIMARIDSIVPDVTVVCPGDWQRLLQRLGWM